MLPVNCPLSSWSEFNSLHCLNFFVVFPVRLGGFGFRRFGFSLGWVEGVG